MHKISKDLQATSKTPDTRRLAWSKFHTENQQILRADVQNLVVTATWYPRFVHSCSIIRQDTNHVRLHSNNIQNSSFRKHGTSLCQSASHHWNECASKLKRFLSLVKVSCNTLSLPTHHVGQNCLVHLGFLQLAGNCLRNSTPPSVSSSLLQCEMRS